jgi:predicted ATPase
MNGRQQFPLHPLKRIKLQNILSFGPEGAELELKPLNVLIGANASGKSNLLEVINLFRSMPTDPHSVLDEAGGLAEWQWKGAPKAPRTAELPEIEVVLEREGPGSALRYSFFLRESPPIFLHERLENAEGAGSSQVHFEVHRSSSVEVKGEEKQGLDTKYSILSQVKDPANYPEVTYLGRLLQEFRLYRDWQFGPAAEIRRPQRGEQARDLLAENASNLALVLEELKRRGAKSALLARLQGVYSEIKDYAVQRPGGYVVFVLREKGMEENVPPERISDGTLRQLALAAILCHPEPPPLICIEEPELGMHPDVLPVIAEMLVEASERTQLIVATHSPELIDALSDTPESVVVCERGENGTEMRRLDPKRLRKWLDRYRLGELWQKGEIGGTRW